MRESLKASQSEAAHVKIFLSTLRGSVIANLASGAAEPVVQSNVEGKPREAGLLVNARVHMSPEGLSAVVENSLRLLMGDNVTTRILGLNSFSPSRPQPTHRYQTVV